MFKKLSINRVFKAKKGDVYFAFFEHMSIVKHVRLANTYFRAYLVIFEVQKAVSPDIQSRAESKVRSSDVC